MKSRAGRLPKNLLPLQSGVGNIANAVLAGLADGGFQGLTAFTEVIQDGMMDLLDSGVLASASATAFSLSPAATERFKERIEDYRKRILLRPQEISNHPELIRRLGCIGMNGMVEADIYGNVNSTHIMGTRVQNGIGGSGDFAATATCRCSSAPAPPRTAPFQHWSRWSAMWTTPSTMWRSSSPNTGLADLRGLSPKQRARVLIDKCAHPQFRDQLEDYFQRACRESYGKHTPHILPEALSWHQRWLDTGDMRAR